MSDSDFLSEEELETIERTREKRREHKAKQQEVLDSISEEHGGELIETPVSLTSDFQATIKTKMNGEVTDSLAYIEDTIESFEEDEGKVRDLSKTADKAATLLGDVIEEPEYNKELFYNVYLQEDLEALGALIEIVFEAIEEEKKRMRGAVDGFRKERE